MFFIVFKDVHLWLAVVQVSPDNSWEREKRFWFVLCFSLFYCCCFLTHINILSNLLQGKLEASPRNSEKNTFMSRLVFFSVFSCFCSTMNSSMLSSESSLDSRLFACSKSSLSESSSEQTSLLSYSLLSLILCERLIEENCCNTVIRGYSSRTGRLLLDRLTSILSPCSRHLSMLFSI